MINFSDNIIWGESLKRKAWWIKRRLRKGKLCAGKYLITSPTNPSNEFDIIDAKFLIFSYYKEREITVYAIAKSQEEAEELLLSLIENKYAIS